MTTTESIRELLMRDLAALKKEIEAYPNTEALWLVSGEINNSAGNLALHICGNLRHFVGATIGHDGYVRQREQEFVQKGISGSDIILEISATQKAVKKALESISDDTLGEKYPIEVFGQSMTFSYFLIHLTGHLMYHLGQINYHRRLLTL